MSLLESIRSWLPGLSVARPRSDEVVALSAEVKTLQEKLKAVESLVDLGDDPDAQLPGLQNQGLFRSVSSFNTTIQRESDRDMNLQTRNKILAMAHKLYAFRGDAHNIIEIFIDFIVGDELIPKAKDEKDKTLQGAIDDIWFDKRNLLWQRAETLIRTLLLEGELFIPCELSMTDGHLEMGYLATEKVAAVAKNPQGVDIYIWIDHPKQPGEKLKYFVLNAMTENVMVRRRSDNGTYEVIETTVVFGQEQQIVTPVDGICFANFNNRPEGATRGRSEMTEIIDYVDLHDELLWSQVEREKLLKLFVMDITAKDVSNAAEAEKKLEELGLKKPPRNPKIICHNDKIDVKLLSPETSGRVTQELEQLLRFNIYGAKGMPEHWSGSGGGTNFATARAQDVVPLRRLRRKQRFVINMFLTIITVSLIFRKEYGGLQVDDDPEFDLTFLEVGGRDRQRGATILKDIIVALSQALSDQILKREAAHDVLKQAIREAGFKVEAANTGLPPEDDGFVGQMRGNLAQMLGPQMQRGSRRGDEGDNPQNEPGERRNARAV